MEATGYRPPSLHGRAAAAALEHLQREADRRMMKSVANYKENLYISTYLNVNDGNGRVKFAKDFTCKMCFFWGLGV